MAYKISRYGTEKPTPKKVSRVIDFICGLLGIATTWIVNEKQIGIEETQIFVSINALLSTVLLYTKKFWYETTE